MEGEREEGRRKGWIKGGERQGECMEGREGAQSCWGDAGWGNGHPGNCIDLPWWGSRCCPTAIPWPCTLEAPNNPFVLRRSLSRVCVSPTPPTSLDEVTWLRSPSQD